MQLNIDYSDLTVNDSVYTYKNGNHHIVNASLWKGIIHKQRPVLHILLP